MSLDPLRTNENGALVYGKCTCLPNMSELQHAYRLGFLRAAKWANRDDLKCDVGSPAYLKDMAEDLSK